MKLIRNKPVQAEGVGKVQEAKQTAKDNSSDGDDAGGDGSSVLFTPRASCKQRAALGID